MPNKIFFNFIVIREEEFANISRCPVKPNDYGGGFLPFWLCNAIVVCEKSYNINNYTKPSYGFIHELVHIWQNYYYPRLYPPIEEGIAELVPFYFFNMNAGLNKDGSKHCDIVKNISEDDIKSITYLNMNNMFEEQTNENVQFRKSYISALLWALGYILEYEDKYDCDKQTAFKHILKGFKKAIEFEHLPDKRYAYIANMIDKTPKALFDSIEIQMKGLEYIKKHF